MVSGWVYLAAFLRELGYASHFSIPLEFIRIDLANLLTLGGAALVLVVAVVGTLHFIVLLKDTYLELKGPECWLDFFNRHMPFAVVALIAWGVAGGHSKDIFQFFLFPLVIVLSEVGTLFLFWRFARPKLDSFRSALEALNRSLKEKPMPSVVSALVPKERSALFTVILLAVFTLYLAYLSGIGEARRKRVYHVTEQREVLLRTYGDRLLLGELSNDARSLLPVLFYREAAAASEFRLLAIGPLLPTSPATYPFERERKEATQNANASTAATNSEPATLGTQEVTQ